MAWGPQLTFFCNDAYRRDTLGKKYPWALGRPAPEVWSEIWPEVAPRIEAVMSTGVATWDKSLMLFAFVVDGKVMLDLAYEEDSRAEVDMNFVLTGAKRIVEIQATAEQHPFDDEQLREMMQLARRGVESLIAKQRVILSGLPLRQ